MGGGRSAWMNAWVSRCACLGVRFVQRSCVLRFVFPLQIQRALQGACSARIVHGHGAVAQPAIVEMELLELVFCCFLFVTGQNDGCCCKVSRRRRPKRKTAHKRAQESPGVRCEQEEMALGKNQKRWDAGSTRRRSNVQPTRQPPFPVLIERSFHPPSPNITA